MMGFERLTPTGLKKGVFVKLGSDRLGLKYNDFHYINKYTKESEN